MHPDLFPTKTRAVTWQGRLPAWRTGSAVGLGLLIGLAAASAKAADRFLETDLLSNGFVPAAHQDPLLVNPWGIAHGPGGPFWISENGSGLAAIVDGGGVLTAVNGFTHIGIPVPDVSVMTAAPTGLVFNGNGGFTVSQGGKSGSSKFIVVTEDGTISGWNPGVDQGHAILALNKSANGTGAVYKGAAIAQIGTDSFLYAANFRSGMVEVYNQAFGLVNSFSDPTLPTGYAPFNVQTLGSHLFVTFALQDAAKHDDVGGAGHGFVDEFNPDGTLVTRLVSGGVLDSPWGLALAPSGFGDFANDLLVGNFGDGTIHAFDPTTGALRGELLDKNGKPIVIGDLWGLIVGGDAKASDPNALYFTAGVQHEAEGLFGSLTSVPELSTWAMMILGFGLVGLRLRRRET